MVIEEEDFRLEYDDNCNRFDLHLIHTKNAKDPEKRADEFKLWGYGMPLSSCVSKIINYRIAKGFDTLSLQQYFEEYKKQADRIAYLAKM